MQTRDILPLKRPVDADVTIPGSKSITNRMLVLAALADGQTQLTRALFSDDTQHMIAALRKLGIRIHADETAQTVTVEGTGGRIAVAHADLFVGNSGTTVRFLTAFVALGNGAYTLDGIDRMRERPIKDLLDGLAPLGVTARCEGKNGACPPVRVIASGLKGGKTAMAGDKSSQYFTALLQVAPYAAQDVGLRVTGDLVSKPYIDLTLGVMRDFGVEVVRHGYETFTIRAGQRYRAGAYAVEPDASNASYFFAAAALTGGRVRVRNLTAQSAQGDIGFVDVLAQMGCDIRKDPEGIEVRGPKKLSGIDIDMNLMPDVVQTLCALAPFASAPVTARNVANMRIKETDRIAALETELTKLGVRVKTWDDGLTVYPADRIRPAALDTYNDHRMAMSLSLIGLKTPGIRINDPACVNKTFPTFFDALDALRH